MCALMFKSSHRLDGKIADMLASTHSCTPLAQLRMLWSTTAGECSRDLQKFPSPQWETHVLLFISQGGGVVVAGGTVSISSSTISGNMLEVCTLMFKASHRPDGIFTCACFALVLADAAGHDETCYRMDHHARFIGFLWESHGSHPCEWERITRRGTDSGTQI